MVKKLGADKVIDYTADDFTKRGETYDVVYDTVGKASFSGCVRSLKKKGCLILSAAGLSQMIQGLWMSMMSGRKFISGVVSEKKEDMVFIKDLIEAGKLQSVIDRTYPIEQIVGAHHYVEQGHKKGNVVITLYP
jgi:NADPH:quinone reductase-like Zn-dependent oxidoreductase